MKDTTKVTVYTTATCPYCVMVKRWLDDNNISYQDVRVDTDQEAARKMVALSGQMGVPFTTIEKEGETGMSKVLGFNVPQLRTILGVS